MKKTRSSIFSPADTTTLTIITTTTTTIVYLPMVIRNIFIQDVVIFSALLSIRLARWCTRDPDATRRQKEGRGGSYSLLLLLLLL